MQVVRWRSCRVSPVTLTLKNLVLNAFYYGVTVAVLPVALLRIEGRWWGAGEPHWILRAISAVLGSAGVLLQGWCIVLLQRRGGGTPSPILPAKHLVTEGPYGWLRNPLNLGEVLLLVALAGWFASWLLLAYAGLAMVGFHIFVIAREEPRHRALFAQPYEAYAARVGRWLPRRPANPGALGPDQPCGLPTSPDGGRRPG
jgi:protein-S-isoprenylcysteine O-methyltransferase Ste14